MDIFRPRPISNGMSKKTKDKNENGITLLLVMIILSALLSISIGIFNIVFGQIKISGDLADSFVAFYAADQAIENILLMNPIRRVL